MKSVTWQPVSCRSDPLVSSWYICKPDALHGCSQDLKSQNPETEILYLKIETLNPQDRDETKTFDFFKLSRPRRSTFKTETRPRCYKKTLSRPPRDWDVQDRDYIPAPAYLEKTLWHPGPNLWRFTFKILFQISISKQHRIDVDNGINGSLSDEWAIYLY